MKVAVIGCGVMGSAFARHFAKKHEVFLCDSKQETAERLGKEIGAKGTGFEEASKHADIFLLAIKPKDLSHLSKTLGPVLSEKKIVISILAGTPVAHLKKVFPKPQIVRAMPNLALTCGEGVIGLVEEPSMQEKTKREIDDLFQGLGLSVWLPEKKVEALIPLAASGIGFVFLLFEAMIDSGVLLGFTAQESREFVLKTFEGAIKLMRHSGKHPAELKLQIASPGGTTITGLRVLEQKGVRSGIMEALMATYEKELKMGQG